MGDRFQLTIWYHYPSNRMKIYVGDRMEPYIAIDPFDSGNPMITKTAELKRRKKISDKLSDIAGHSGYAEHQDYKVPINDANIKMDFFDFGASKVKQYLVKLNILPRG